MLFTFSYLIQGRLHVALVMGETKEQALEKARAWQKIYEQDYDVVMIFDYHDYPIVQDLHEVNLNELKDEVITVFQEHS